MAQPEPWTNDQNRGGLMPLEEWKALERDHPLALRRCLKHCDKKQQGKTLPSKAVIALHRMGFGAGPGDYEAFAELGSDDQIRFERYVEQQLDPMSLDDCDVDQRMDEAGYETYDKSLEQLWKEHRLNYQDYDQHIRPAREVERATFLRATYSKRQLLEVMVNFWHRHFNVLGWGFGIGPIFTHYDRDIIRAHALGNFRDMLEAVAQSPVMLYYLDNYKSINAGPNENYVRELFEYHTLGAKSYLGAGLQSEVPLDDDGVPIGYVDTDIYEATRCFTGWSVDDSCCGNTGAFAYHKEWHDRFQKNVLGSLIPADQPPLQDGRCVLALLARHPGTAFHISQKLCQLLIAERPPRSVIEEAAKVFRDECKAPDQLRKVVRTILLSEAFQKTWGQRVKRPFEMVIGALRSTRGNFSFALDDAATDDFLYRYQHSGHRLFTWGLPSEKNSDERREDQGWISQSPQVTCWRLVNWLVVARDEEKNYRLDILGQTPAEKRSAVAIVDFWSARIFGQPMRGGDRQELIEFLAQAEDPESDLMIEPYSKTHGRLQAMVGLLFMSPGFLVC